MLGALLYLRLKSLENQVRSRTGRLRQPKNSAPAPSCDRRLFLFLLPFCHLSLALQPPGWARPWTRS